ncbi:type II secretion system F family protein [Patescibacteria group bacterium]|nr:type II secretion system F family protein [Patescibacteria group bacterium]MBU2036276.1 type II secretion system F family protein [Patescibacteria group bacterium]
MKLFNYKAKDKSNELVTGEVEATDERHAAKLVRERGLIVLTIKPVRESIFGIIKKLKEKVTSSDVTSFTRQLSTMINAGLPITEALHILRNQLKGSMQKVVATILSDIEGGESLSSSLEKHKKVFSSTYIALIKSGEVGGVLDEVLASLADNIEKQQEFKGKVKGALIYPVIIVVGMFAVSLIMMIFVMPRLMSLYQDFNAELPLPTKILIGTSNFIFKFWPLVLVLVGSGFYGFSLYRKTPKGRRKIDELIFKIPIFGSLQRQIILTDLTRTLSLMSGAGVSILEALNITAEVVGNVVISEALKDAAIQVEKGFPVAFSFARHPDAFPYILSQMVAVGEETGKMEEVLKKISHVFEIESDEEVKGLTAAIEPVIMIILGLGVGFLVIAVILPIYNLTSSF